MSRTPGFVAALLAIVAVVAVSPPAAAQSAAQNRQQARGESCCAITAIDARAGTVTAVVKGTGRSFTLSIADRALLASLKVGAAVYDTTPPACQGNAASGAGGTTNCGSNVGRYAQTKTCWIQGKNGKWEAVPCTR